MTEFLQPVLAGDEWERFCVRALERKFDPNFQPVPARFRGDYGLDGFVRDECLFQCFGDEAGASASQRSEAQRRKLRDDIPKLRSKATPIAALAGTGIPHYILLVSKLEDKAVAEAAKDHTDTVLSWGLDYLSADFGILVKDIDYLQVEWDLLYGAVRPQLEMPAPAVTAEDVDRLATDPLASTMTDKLHHIVLDDDVGAWRNRLLIQRAKEIVRMEDLRGDGEIFERVRQLKIQQENSLGMRALASDPKDDLLKLGDTHTQILRGDVASLPLDAASDLAWGAIADWLMRCPLDYRPPS